MRSMTTTDTLVADLRFSALLQIVGAEIGGESEESLRDLFGADYEREMAEIRARVQSAALDYFPNWEAPEMFAELDSVAATEFGIHW